MLRHLAILVLQVIASTWRIKIIGQFPQMPAVVAFWHGNMLPIWKMFAHKPVYAVVSQHKDGELLAQLLTKWQYNLFRGSSTRGGKEVIDEVVNVTEDAYFLITPDGPKGPRRKCKAGAFVIAQRKQIPLYFLVYDISCKKIFSKSWDKFELPLPFSTIDVTISNPMDIPIDMTKEQITEFMILCDNNFEQ